MLTRGSRGLHVLHVLRCGLQSAPLRMFLFNHVLQLLIQLFNRSTVLVPCAKPESPSGQAVVQGYDTYLTRKSVVFYNLGRQGMLHTIIIQGESLNAKTKKEKLLGFPRALSLSASHALPAMMLSYTLQWYKVQGTRYKVQGTRYKVLHDAD